MSEAGPPTDPFANPWTRLDRRVVYDNPWIRVFEDQVIRPDGQPGIYGVVHYHNDAVGVLPVDDQGRITMVGQFRYPQAAYSWEIPEGGSPRGESVEETARRELLEETGLTAEHWEPFGTAYLSNSVSDECAYLFRATGLTSGRNDPEGTERLVIQVFDWDDLWAMLLRHEITDSLTVMALYREALRRAGVPLQAPDANRER